MGQDNSSRRIDPLSQAMRQEPRVHSDEPASQKVQLPPAQAEFAASRDAYARLEASNQELRRQIRQREQAEQALDAGEANDAPVG